MQAFYRQDEEYLNWLDGHQRGFVVNALRNLDPSYLMLHRASRGTISGTPARGNTWTNGDYIKTCGDTIRDLEEWGRQETSGTLQPCKLCRPK